MLSTQYSIKNNTKGIAMIDTVYWYTPSMTQPLRGKKYSDVVVIGGGMAGLSAAYECRKNGLSVILLEKRFCGAGASGKSSGFITPDSELDVNYFIDTFGASAARRIWELGIRGVDHIRNTIKQYDIECDYTRQDCLAVASTPKNFEKLHTLHHARLQLDFPSTLISKEDLGEYCGAQGYYGALSYGDTFAIRSFHYCQGMKKVLLEMGVDIYETSPALTCKQGIVTTEHGIIKADRIIICADWEVVDLKKLIDKVYHAQTFLMISQPLVPDMICYLFPEKLYMVWDTELIYNYFRLTGDYRLLLGGGSIFSSYDKHAAHNFSHIIKKFTTNWKNHFPHVPLKFDYIWSGLIGVSKDIRPLIGFDPHDASLYYVTACAGLPWAATLGLYAAEKIYHGRSDFDEYFSLTRSFMISGMAQKILGTRATFAVSHFLMQKG